MTKLIRLPGILRIRYDNVELEFDKDDVADMTLEPNGKLTIPGSLKLRHKGKQRFPVYIDYSNGHEEQKAWVTIAVK